MGLKTKRKRVIDERVTGRDDHCTPLWLVQKIASLSGSGRIGLDPAGTRNRRAPVLQFAHRMFHKSRGANGLTMSWRRYGLVFCNPEYGREVALWTAHAIKEFGIDREPGADDDQDALVLLVAARVDARWFRRTWQHASALCLLEKRITFCGQPDPAKFPSAIFCFGGETIVGRFVAAFAPHGTIVYSSLRPFSDSAVSRQAMLSFSKRFPETWLKIRKTQTRSSRSSPSKRKRSRN